MCENPNRTVEDYKRSIAAKIQRNGWAVQYVEPGGARAPWAYTVGLTLYELPELLVTGLPPDKIDPYLNGYGRHLFHDDPPEPGAQFELIGTPRVEVVAVAQPDVHLAVAASMFARDVRALQLVWSDDRGKWPWDRGFRSRRWPQPVLGERARPAPASGPATPPRGCG